jgi:hypothetical protein
MPAQSLLYTSENTTDKSRGPPWDPHYPLLVNIFTTAFEVEAINSSLMKPKFWHTRG